MQDEQRVVEARPLEMGCAAKGAAKPSRLTPAASAAMFRASLGKGTTTVRVTLGSRAAAAAAFAMQPMTLPPPR